MEQARRAVPWCCVSSTVLAGRREGVNEPDTEGGVPQQTGKMIGGCSFFLTRGRDLVFETWG